MFQSDQFVTDLGQVRAAVQEAMQGYVRRQVGGGSARPAARSSTQLSPTRLNEWTRVWKDIAAAGETAGCR